MYDIGEEKILSGEVGMVKLHSIWQCRLLQRGFPEMEFGSNYLEVANFNDYRQDHDFREV